MILIIIKILSKKIKHLNLINIALTNNIYKFVVELEAQSANVDVNIKEYNPNVSNISVCQK